MLGRDAGYRPPPGSPRLGGRKESRRLRQVPRRHCDGAPLSPQPGVGVLPTSPRGLAVDPGGWGGRCPYLILLFATNHSPMFVTFFGLGVMGWTTSLFSLWVF